MVTQVGSDIYEFYEVERNAKEFDIITFVRWIKEKRKGSYINKCYPIWWKLKLEILRHEEGIVSYFPMVMPNQCK